MVFEGVKVCTAEFWKSKFLSCFPLWSYNHQCYDKMEGTTGFSSSNRSRNHLDGLSNGRLRWLYGGKNSDMIPPHPDMTPPHPDVTSHSNGMSLILMWHHITMWRFNTIRYFCVCYYRLHSGINSEQRVPLNWITLSGGRLAFCEHSASIRQEFEAVLAKG